MTNATTEFQNVRLESIKKTDFNGNDISVHMPQNINPLDNAMLQALYARSPLSVKEHIEKLNTGKSGEFMKKWFVGYNHKSIADCDGVTFYIENVSMLAAKAIQQNPLYSGQETSTRAVDYSTRNCISIDDNTNGMKGLQQTMMAMYSRILDKMIEKYNKEDTTVCKTEKEEANKKNGIRMRALDIARGFLPAGATTQLSWTSNFRQLNDNLLRMKYHPLQEVCNIAHMIIQILNNTYPDILTKEVKNETTYEQNLWYEKQYFNAYDYTDLMQIGTNTVVNIFMHHQPNDIQKMLLEIRPQGCELSSDMGKLMNVGINGALDFGSFRDQQRHRNSLPYMPILNNQLFHKFYLNEILRVDPNFHEHVIRFIEYHTNQLNMYYGKNPSVYKQYACFMGNMVNVYQIMPLNSFVYYTELRSGPSVHPILREFAHEVGNQFLTKLKTEMSCRNEKLNMKLYLDNTPTDFTRRGKQTITPTTNEK